MKNTEAVERFDQLPSGVKIENLIWIAGAMESRHLKDLLIQMEHSDYEKCFPGITQQPHFVMYRTDEDETQLLIDLGKFGLLAEIHIPTSDDFTFEKGKPTSWSTHENRCMVEYVYGENLTELMQAIEKITASTFAKFVKREKDKKLKLKTI